MASKGLIRRSVVVESRPSAIIGMYNSILSELKSRNFKQEDIFAVHLALEEAFLNAVKHGNKMDPHKGVKIEYLVDLDKVEISMTDEGDGFDPGIVPDPRSGENIYKIYGRGLFLMRSYMSEVEFNNRGNCVRMVRYKGRPSLAEMQNQTRSSE